MSLGLRLIAGARGAGAAGGVGALNEGRGVGVGRAGNGGGVTAGAAGAEIASLAEADALGATSTCVLAVGGDAAAGAVAEVALGITPREPF